VWWFVVIVGAAVVACNGPGTPTGGPPAGAFECGDPDYPCDPADVSDEVVERGAALMEAAFELLEGGATYDAIAAWLRSDPDVAEAHSSAHALRFRLAGGRAQWLSELLLGDVEADASMDASFLPVERSDTLAETNSNRAPKHALVLSALFAEYQLLQDEGTIAAGTNLITFDPGYRVAAVLDGSTRTPFFDRVANESTVEHLVNAKDEEQITIATFTTFDRYDLVYVGSHGATVCEVAAPAGLDVCRTIITIGDRWPPFVPCERLADGRFLDCVTIAIRKPDGTIARTFNSRAITADFLAATYPQGFSNTIIWFGGCSLFHYVVGDYPVIEHRFRELLSRGTNSVFFGWTDLISPVEDGAAARSVFGTLMSDGVVTGDVFHDVSTSQFDFVNSEGRTSELMRFGTHVLPERSNRDRNHGFAEPLTVDGMGRAAAATPLTSEGPDLRIREVVTLVDATGWPLTDGDGLTPFIDGVAGDGAPDRLDLHVQVDGVLPGEMDDFVLRFELDGQPIGRPVSLSQANAVPFDEPFSVLAHVTGIDTGIDFAANASYELEAIVDLPEGGSSRYEVILATSLCFADAVIDGTYQATVRGPARFSFIESLGMLFLWFDDWDHLRYRAGQQSQGGFSIVGNVAGLGSTLVPGGYDLQELEIVYHPAQLDGLIEWSARQTAHLDCFTAPCPDCEPIPCGSGRLTITEVSDLHLRGHVVALAFGVEPYEEWPPPYWEVTFEATFDAVTGAPPNVDPDSDYAVCVAAGL